MLPSSCSVTVAMPSSTFFCTFSEISAPFFTIVSTISGPLASGRKEFQNSTVFLKNPPILIFDEATSALDNESEQIVQESLEKLAKNRTTFVIAHRLTTIENAEEILMLTDEGIKERGTHEELMKLDGEYARMVKIHSRT